MALDDIANQLDALQQDPSTPEWAETLIKCVGKMVNFVLENQKLNERVKTLEKSNKELKEELKMIKAQVDASEQKYHSSCLLLHGIPEKENEDTDDACVDFIEKEVGVDIKDIDVSRSNRIGPKKPVKRITKSRPIMVRFTTMKKRLEVFNKKSNLKGKSFLITESLTSYGLTILQQCKKYGVRKTATGSPWSSEEKLFAKVNNRNSQYENLLGYKNYKEKNSSDGELFLKVNKRDSAEYENLPASKNLKEKYSGSSEGDLFAKVNRNSSLQYKNLALLDNFKAKYGNNGKGEMNEQFSALHT